MKFPYLRVLIIYGDITDVTEELKMQTNISNCSNIGEVKRYSVEKLGTKNKKKRIYQSCVRPIIAYSMEKRAFTKKNKAPVKNEMRVLRTISG